MKKFFSAIAILVGLILLSGCSKSMSLKEIKEGNFTSIKGSWKEVARLSVDEYGDKKWLSSSGESLVVTPNKIKGSNFSLVMNNLQEGDYLSAKLKNTENNGMLLQSINLNKNYDLTDKLTILYIPKSVEFDKKIKKLFPDIKSSKSFETAKDRIIVASSKKNTASVFEIQTGDKDQEKLKSRMLYSEINKGNYQSISGKWKNEVGDTIEIDKNKIQFSNIISLKDFDVRRKAIIEGNKLNIPDDTDEDGQPNKYRNITSMVPAYDPKLQKEFVSDNIFSLKSHYTNASLFISFLPAGEAGYISGTLSNKEINSDKIISQVTQNDATLITKKSVYYKVN